MGKTFHVTYNAKYSIKFVFANAREGENECVDLHIWFSSVGCMCIIHAYYTVYAVNDEKMRKQRAQKRRM